MQSPDLNGENSVFTLIPPRNVLVASGTATFTGVDMKDYIGNCKLILSIADPSATVGTVTINLLTSADNTTYAAITSPTFTATTADGVVESVALDTRTLNNRYLQGRHVVTGTTATKAISLIGVGLKQVV